MIDYFPPKTGQGGTQSPTKGKIDYFPPFSLKKGGDLVNHQFKANQSIAKTEALATELTNPTFGQTVKTYAKNLPSAIGEVAYNAVRHPIYTASSALGGIVDLASIVLNAANIIPNKLGVKTEQFPLLGTKFNEAIGNDSDVQRAIREATGMVAGYELGGVITKSAGMVGPSSRIAGNILGGQITSDSNNLKDRGTQAVIDATLGVAAEGLTGGFKKPVTPTKPSGKIDYFPPKPVEVPKTNGMPSVESVPPVMGGDSIPKPSKDMNIYLASKGVAQVPEEELAKFTSISKEQQIRNIGDLITNDPAGAESMALGKTNIPAGISPQALWESVAQKADLEGNYALSKQLAGSPISTARAVAAQELGASGWFGDGASSASAIQDLQKTRTKVAQEKFGISNVNKTQSDIVSVIKKEIKKSAPTKQTWSEFIASIEC